jgi:outer membrane biosynthesis protein TonB
MSLSTDLDQALRLQMLMHIDLADDEVKKCEAALEVARRRRHKAERLWQSAVSGIDRAHVQQHLDEVAELARDKTGHPYEAEPAPKEKPAEYAEKEEPAGEEPEEAVPDQAAEEEPAEDAAEEGPADEEPAEEAVPDQAAEEEAAEKQHLTAQQRSRRNVWEIVAGDGKHSKWARFR